MALLQSPCCFGDAGVLRSLHVTLCNSGRFFTLRTGMLGRKAFCGGWCSRHRLAFPLVSSGLLHLLHGWLCLLEPGSMIHELSSTPVGNNWG